VRDGVDEDVQLSSGVAAFDIGEGEVNAWIPSLGQVVGWVSR
jgi:hypothetical protein